MPDPTLLEHARDAVLPPLAARAGELVGVCAGLAEDPLLAVTLTDLAAALRDEVRLAGPDPDPAARLGTALGLTPFEYDLMLLAGLPEEHEAPARLARMLHARGEPRFAMGALAAVLGLGLGGRRYLRHAVDGGPLHRFLGVGGPESVPLPERGLRLPAGLWSVLRGVEHWPSALRPLTLPTLPGSLPPQSRRLDEVLGTGARLVVVTGTGRTDVELAASTRAGLSACGRGAVAIAAADLDADRAPAWGAHVLARGAVPVVVGHPAGAPLPDHPAPVVVAAATTTGLPMDDRPVLTVELAAPGIGATVEMWQALLPELNGAGVALAGLVRVGELGALRATVDTRATAAGLDPTALSVAGVVAQVRRRTDVTLPRSVRLVRPDATLGQLVLPVAQHRLLCSVVDRVRGQARVLHDWGFGAAARHHGGARMLLSGPPGTGKTLAVEAITAELGLDLLAVDLAALVSKWLGETEKNIAEVFDAAERCQAVLFFDEADAVFGRRTDSSDAQGRWANLETAYLLSRIDRSAGLVVLATNLRRNIDDAFLRRLDVVVELEEPDRAAREQLWRRHLPDAAPCANDIDVGALAAMYEITGGLIRNAALAAAFGAAAAARPIDQGRLITAVHDEYRKAGRSFPGTPRTATRARGGT